MNRYEEAVYLDAWEYNEVSEDMIISNTGKALYIGEVHEQDWLVRELSRLLRGLCHEGKLSFLAVEYFNVEQQDILDRWLEGYISFQELKDMYDKGPEGFNLNVYRPILEVAKDCGTRIVGVMPPRTIARQVSREMRVPLQYTHAPNPADMSNEYKQLLSKLFPREGPMARIPLNNLLFAQSFKDSVAASRIAEALRMGPGAVIMGWAHVEVKGAVATRTASLTGMERSDYLVLGAGVREHKIDFTRRNRRLLETDYLLVK